MKSAFLLILTIYQKVFSSLVKNLLGVNAFCRFSPSCSEYAKRSVINHGIFRGLYLSTIRILSCNSTA